MRKVKVFLCGDYRINAGPSNVNRYIIENSKKQYYYIGFNNKILKYLEMCIKILYCDIVVFSGLSGYIYWGLKLLKFSKKKIVYLMHGCLEYESKINNHMVIDKDLQIEMDILNKADLILCVSEKYMYWVKERYTKHKNKIYYLNNGIQRNVNFNSNTLNNIEIDNSIYNIAVMGGDRKQKNNLDICKAIEKINKKTSIKVKLHIFGESCEEYNVFDDYSNAIYHGHVSTEKLYSMLKKIDLFILNSEVESFGLAVIDALENECSILIGKNAGVISILSLQEMDIIENPHNLEEISNKIIYILKNPNNRRIRSSIDYDKYSWNNVAKRLYEICGKVIKNDGYEDIK